MIENEIKQVYSNLPCTYTDPTTGILRKGKILAFYEIEDKTAVPTDEVYEIHTNVIPAHAYNRSATDSCSGCTSTGSGTYAGYTETKTLTRKVRPIIRVCQMLRDDGLIEYDIPVDTVRSDVGDLPTYGTV